MERPILLQVRFYLFPQIIKTQYHTLLGIKSLKSKNSYLTRYKNKNEYEKDNLHFQTKIQTLKVSVEKTTDACNQKYVSVAKCGIASGF